MAGTDYCVGLLEVAAFVLEERNARPGGRGLFCDPRRCCMRTGGTPCEVILPIPTNGTVLLERDGTVAFVGWASEPLIVHCDMYCGAAQGVG